MRCRLCRHPGRIPPRGLHRGHRKRSRSAGRSRRSSRCATGSPEIRLIDPHGGIAQGKTLDILQSSPVESFSTRLVAAQTLHSAAGAAAIVLADAGATGIEHAGETGSLDGAADRRGGDGGAAGLRRRAAAANSSAGRLANYTCRDRECWGRRSVALESALRALAGLAMDTSGVEVQLQVVGTPPRACGGGLGRSDAARAAAAIGSSRLTSWRR